MLILEILKSKYCQIVFLISLVIGYFLVPSSVFASDKFYFGYIFIITFALVVTCLVRGIKERIKSFKTYGAIGLASLSSLIAYLSLQVCGIGSLCINIGIGILSLLPSSILPIVYHNYEIIFAFSIALQIFTLYLMGCFKKFSIKTIKI